MSSGIQRPLRARTCILLASIFASPLFWNVAHAVTVEVPADVYTFDDPTTSFYYTFSDLNGTALTGQSISIDFVFAQPISVQPNRHDQADSLITFIVQLFLDSVLTFHADLPLPSGFLFDASGPLPPLIISRGFEVQGDLLQAYFNFGPEDLIDGILIPGLHVELDLPQGAPQVVGAALGVGNPTPIAEPGTLALLGLGLLGLGLTRRSL